MSNDAREFLTALWPAGLPPRGHLVLTSKRGQEMVPEYYDSVLKASERACDIGRERDVYVGMAAQPKARKGRGTTATAIAIPGLWLDLDFDKGFSDLDGVLHFLDALPLQPSVLVLTGGGVHGHWLFNEWLPCSGTSSDTAASGLELGWLRYCREIARVELKAELDAVADLARVLRVPGTNNFKRTPAVPVTLRPATGRRYDPAEFEQWRSASKQTYASVVAATASFEFVLNEDAQPPFKKWAAVCEIDPEIADVFEHRKRMPLDNSLSGYDLSIATRLDALGWTSQEIVDTIMAHRKQWMGEITDRDTIKDPLHLQDPGYYERLLRKARASNAGDHATTTLVAEVVTALEDDPTPTNDVRQKWFRALFEITNVDVIDLWAVDRIEGVWNLRVRCLGGEMRDVPISSPEKLLSWSFWKKTILISGANIESIPKKEPASLHQLASRSGLLLRVLPPQGARRMDELVSYLLELAESAVQFEQANVLDRQPFRRVDSGPAGIATWGQPEECLFLRTETVQFDAKIGRAPRFDNLRHELLSLGFVARTVATRTNNDQTTTRNYLAMPMRQLRSAASKHPGTSSAIDATFGESCGAADDPAGRTTPQPS